MSFSKQRFISITIVALFFVAFSFGQWTKGKNNGYYKIAAWYLEADQHYTDTGAIEPNATRGQFSMSFYGEYGVAPKWDAVVYIPFFARTFQNDIVSGTTGEVITEGEAVNSVGDIDIGIRYGILKSDWFAMSVAGKVGLPTGEDAGGSDGSFQTGDGEFNQSLQLDLGSSFSLWNLPSYAKTYFQFNHRTNDFSDELRTGLELGTQLVPKKLYLIARVDILQSLQNGSLSAQNAQGSIFSNNMEFIGVGGEVAYYFTDKLGITFNYTSAVDGRIVYAAPSFSSGVFLDIK